MEVWAFETQEPEKPAQSLDLPQSSRWPEQYPLLTAPFYSSADLSQVQYIQPCTVGDVITGLLLHYIAGHGEVVGQVRPDCLLRAIQMDGQFWLGLQDLDGCFQVTHASTSQTGIEDWKHVVRLRGVGRLEWWWLPRTADRPQQA